MRKLLIVIVMMSLFFLPNIAQAEYWEDTFSDESMNSTLWSYYDDGNSKTTLYEQNGLLNFSASGILAGERSDKGYVSNVMSVDFSKDFWARLEFHNDNDGFIDTAVVLGLIELQAGVPVFNASLSAGNESDLGNRFWTDVSKTGNPSSVYDGFTRTVDAGWLNLNYDTALDSLSFRVTNLAGDTDLVDISYDNFCLDWEPETMQVFVGGGVKFIDADMGMDNFQGNIAPEPVSAVLFLLGGMGMAARKFFWK